jgi:hypothetical protein
MPIRVANPWLVPRRIFMGQTPQANRLFDVRTSVIAERGSIAMPAMVPYKLVPPWYRPRDLSLKMTAFPWEIPSTWSEEEKAALEASGKAPTQDELRDVKLIDSFFGFVKPPPSTPSEITYERPNFGGLLYMLLCGGSYYYPPPGDVSLRGRPFIQNAPLITGSGYDPAFFCTGAVEASGILSSRVLRFFKIDSEARWGDNQLIMRNAKVLLDVMETYPFPSPLSASIDRWYWIAQDKLAEAARYKGPMDPQVARFILTLIVLDTYVQASNEIMDYFEDKAKRQKRNAIILAIAISVWAILVPVLAGAALSAITTVISARDAKDAAKDMIKAAQQFEATDAEFAGEIRRAAEIIDYQAAQEAGATPLTPEEEDALREFGQEGEITPGDVEAAKNKKPKIAELLVGGSVAAGLVALLFLK